MSTLIIANNLPDVDVAVFATHTLPMSFRRGWTHGVLAQLALPIALTAIMLLVDRLFRKDAPDRVKVVPLLVLSYVGVLLHVFFDFLNSYGVRLLMPFSDRWFYGDALYIVDPILYLTLGLGWWISSRRDTNVKPNPFRPARIGLTIAAIYIVAMLGVEPAGEARGAKRVGARRASARHALDGDAGVRKSVASRSGDRLRRSLREGTPLVRAVAAFPSRRVRRGERAR